MKALVVLFLFCSSTVMAQYDQLVTPTKIEEVVSFTQYQLRQALKNFFKQSKGVTRVSSTQLLLQVQIPCVSSDLNETSTLSVVRTPIQPGPAGEQIRESLFLNTCNQRTEIYAVERHGQALTPTSDDDLIRGNIPGAANFNFYRLNLMNQSIKIEISKSEKDLKLNLAITQDSLQAQMQLSESYSGQTLIHQAMTGTYSNGGRADTVDSEFVWIIDQKNAVPRQYLYIQQNEVSPGTFLKLRASIYAGLVFPMIQKLFELR